MARRVVIKPTEAGIAAELLERLNDITADGHISDDEARGLNEWLVVNRAADHPAFTLLRELLTRVLADHAITGPERTAIHQAAERILPPELRAHAKAKRIARTLADRAEAENRRPIASDNFMVAGVSHDGRSEIIEAHVRAGTVVYLRREPSNPYDANAIQVLLREGWSIGYVPRANAMELAPLLDDGAQHVAWCTKILRGNWLSVPVIEAKLFRAGISIPNAVSQENTPRHTTYRAQAATSVHSSVSFRTPTPNPKPAQTPQPVHFTTSKESSRPWGLLLVLLTVAVGIWLLVNRG